MFSGMRRVLRSGRRGTRCLVWSGTSIVAACDVGTFVPDGRRPPVEIREAWQFGASLWEAGREASDWHERARQVARVDLMAIHERSPASYDEMSDVSGRD